MFTSSHKLFWNEHTEYILSSRNSRTFTICVIYVYYINRLCTRHIWMMRKNLWHRSKTHVRFDFSGYPPPENVKCENAEQFMLSCIYYSIYLYSLLYYKNMLQRLRAINCHHPNKWRVNLNFAYFIDLDLYVYTHMPHAICVFLGLFWCAFIFCHHLCLLSISLYFSVVHTMRSQLPLEICFYFVFWSFLFNLIFRQASIRAQVVSAVVAATFNGTYLCVPLLHFIVSNIFWTIERTNRQKIDE